MWRPRFNLSNKHQRVNNVSEFLQLIANIGGFRGLDFCLVYGIMEWWNNGMLVFKGSYTFFNSQVKRDFANKPLSHFPRTHYSIIPLFHYSNGERSELSSQEEKKGLI